MKFGICSLAFVIGCFFAVYVRVNANSVSGEIAPPKQLITVTDTNVQVSFELGIETKPFGLTKDHQPVTQFRCTNENGYVLELIDYGATVTSLQMPDRSGKLANITLGCEDMNGYEACTSYFGSSVGRFCNRIAAGKFSIDGKEFTLATNNAPNHLHGGIVGFDKQMWESEILKSDDSIGVRFSLVSKDGDEGYPGTLKVTVDYVLTNDDELVVDFRATTDKKTHVNLTNHNYWNLGGQSSGPITDHVVKLESDKYLPVDETAVPTGELLPVAETPFDFSEWQRIGEQIDEVGSEPKGYDHCYALRNQTGELSLAATVREPKSGRTMEIFTTQPGIQFYTGNFLDGQPGSGGFNRHHAFCLETQHFPDAPNQKEFGSTLLSPGETYHQKTVHKFSVEPARK